jgi:hypothetical protein
MFSAPQWPVPDQPLENDAQTGSSLRLGGRRRVAGLGRSRPGTAGEDVSEPGGMMTMRDIADQAAEAIRALRDLTSGGSAFAGLDDTREVIASLERVGQDLPQLCEQLARILVVQREESQLAAGAGQILTSGWWRRWRRSRRRAGRGHDDRRPGPGGQDGGRAQAGPLRPVA